MLDAQVLDIVKQELEHQVLYQNELGWPVGEERHRETTKAMALVSIAHSLDVIIGILAEQNEVLGRAK